VVWLGLRSRIEPFRTLAKTVRQHWEGILAYFASGLTSAAIEAINDIHNRYIFVVSSSIFGSFTAVDLLKRLLHRWQSETYKPMLRREGQEQCRNQAKADARWTFNTDVAGACTYLQASKDTHTCW
jgi:Transposase